MLSIREFINIIKGLFDAFMQYIMPLFKKEEEGTDDETTAAV